MVGNNKSPSGHSRAELGYARHLACQLENGGKWVPAEYKERCSEHKEEAEQTKSDVLLIEM